MAEDAGGSPLARLARRYGGGESHGGLSAAALVEFVAEAASGRAPSLPSPDPDDLEAAIRLVGLLRRGLDETERALIEADKDLGRSWPRMATGAAAASGDALRQRYRQLGGTRTWSSGRHRDDHPDPGGRVVPFPGS